MNPERRNQILLAGLVVVLLVVAARAWRSTSVAPPPSSNGAAGNGVAGRRGVTAAAPGAPDVHLEALVAERPKPGGPERNLFRFKPKPPPAPTASSQAGRGFGPPPAPTGPPPPPPLPPIALKFIGIVEKGDKSERYAVLSDGRGGVPFSGKEGDIIEGRYRILRIGNESIEMAYLDGRGRQTIRLSGS